PRSSSASAAARSATSSRRCARPASRCRAIARDARERRRTMTTTSGISMTHLLAEMQRLAATADARPPTAEPLEPQQGFAELLRSSIDAVSQAQTTAYNMAAALERGDKYVALPDVMIALQKANLSFQAMTEVRNRLVNAYQEVMNMPI